MPAFETDHYFKPITIILDGRVYQSTPACDRTSIIAVCSPSSEPSELFQCFVEDLGITRFDVLIPDANYQDTIISIGNYYKKLIDLWWGKYAKNGVKIRILEGMIKGVLGEDLSKLSPYLSCC